MLLACVSQSFAGVIIINPGISRTVCAGDSVQLGNLSGPTATGGTAPYTYSWSPTAGMNNPADSTPTVKITATTKFYITVVDAGHTRAFDSITITIDSVANVSAGNPAFICPYTGVATIGSPTNPNVSYTWFPTTGLKCSTCPVTQDSGITATTTYTLYASDGTCKDSSTVTISVLPPAPITTVSPITINRGQLANLKASGGIEYVWEPNANIILGANSANAQADPVVTTTYTVEGVDAAGCIGIDSVVVNVIQDSILYFYNTFTPNGDGINDKWVIGNIQYYPNNEVDIYNRYGAQVYRANGYLNQWDGTFLGTELPDATYYYIVSTGTGATYKGSVTIIRKPQ